MSERRRCSMLAIMPSGMYRCVLDSGHVMGEHHFNYYRPFTSAEQRKFYPADVSDTETATPTLADYIARARAARAER